MEYEFDPIKNTANMLKHGLPFEAVQFFDWATARIKPDTRFDYPEPRFEATGYVGSRLYVVVFCIRDQTKHIISMRKANPREVKRYAST